MSFQPVLDAFGGNLTFVGTGASTANQHAPHVADNVLLHSHGTLSQMAELATSLAV